MTTAGMRFSLTSDTHGNLGVINDLAARVQADAVIHAGDFGFYDMCQVTPSLTKLRDTNLYGLSLQKESKKKIFQKSNCVWFDR